MDKEYSEFINFLSNKLELYSVCAALINGKIAGEIIKYINKEKLSTVEFAKRFKISNKKVNGWISEVHDFTITEIIFLLEKKVVSEKVLTGEVK